MSESKQDSRIWVGHISKEVTERELKDEFGSFGEISEVKYVTSGQYDNYAFIQFDNRESADQAMAKGGRIEFAGKVVRVGPANAKASGRAEERRRSRSRSVERPRSSFYDRPDRSSEKVQIKVSNLPSDMTWQELKRLGGDYGNSVSFARTWRENDGVSGILEFTDKRDAEKVISSLDGKRMEGSDSRLRVDWEKGDRKRSEDRGRKRSPERSSRY